MKYNRMPGTDLDVSIICLGTIRFDEILSVLGEKVGDSLTGFAIRSLLASPLIPSVTVSLNSTEQVDQIAAAVEAPLPDGSAVDQAWELWQKHTGH